MLNFAAIDFETANQHRTSVCSVGIVIVKEGEIVDRFYSLIKPEPEYYTYWNTRVHGLTMDDTCNAPVFPQVWKKAEPLIADLPLVAHNKPFDESCLKAVFKMYGMDYPDYDFYCTLKAARRVYKHLPNHQLHTVAQYCGFVLDNHHHALADAEACAWIAREIVEPTV
ncbi:3'-5' exonuclease [Geofilum sp. OHC36d9]|uniref:3'-5' exonuclease n=1 Tax=Geofilum sp. OHC36d9 TaxID=3458413 RepID=UPI0040340943